eukprot:1879555-Rhodomonas_salina.1
MEREGAGERAAGRERGERRVWAERECARTRASRSEWSKSRCCSEREVGVTGRRHDSIRGGGGARDRRRGRPLTGQKPNQE